MTITENKSWPAYLAAIDRELPSLLDIRHDLHRHPEIGFKEVRTAGIVAAYLRDCGLEVEQGIGGTGVVATLRGHPGNRAIGLRCDMDALAINEASGVPHSSVYPGMMHGCGHDGHMTMLLGAAKLLSQNPDFSGTLHFIFQPAEEGLGGAPAMLRDGLFDRYPCDAIFGLHNKPGLPHGTFSIVAGPMLASADTFTVRFGGNGGHGGSGPHLSIDPTLPAAQLILALQTVVGRNVWAMDQAVLSVGHISGGSYESPNVIPTEVVVRGTARSFKPQTRDLLERRIRELAASAAAAFGTTHTVEYDRLFPSMVNDAEMTRRAADVARQLVGEDMVNTNVTPGMGAEDFAYMLEHVPGSFMFLGAGDGPMLHTASYDFDDSLIPAGIQYWLGIVSSELAGTAQ